MVACLWSALGTVVLVWKLNVFFIWQILSPGFKMMGLGNGRRSMKSPPLIMAALVACVIVLGFNYWLASSRSMELQVSCLFRMHGSCVMFKVAG